MSTTVWDAVLWAKRKLTKCDCIVLKMTPLKTYNRTSKSHMVCICRECGKLHYLKEGYHDDDRMF